MALSASMGRSCLAASEDELDNLLTDAANAAPRTSSAPPNGKKEEVGPRKGQMWLWSKPDGDIRARRRSGRGA